MAAALGLEAYGIGGLVVTTLLAIFLAAVVRTLTAEAADDPALVAAGEIGEPAG